MEDYLPDPQDRLRLPRQWVINLFNSVIGKPFARFVNDIIQKRNETLADKNNLMIEMDPEIAHIFSQSTSISSKLKLISPILTSSNTFVSPNVCS